MKERALNHRGRYIGHGMYLANVPLNTPIDPELRAMVEEAVLATRAEVRAIRGQAQEGGG